MAIDAGFFASRYFIPIAKHKNVLPKTLDFLAKESIKGYIVIVELALSVIQNPNTSDDTLNLFVDIIRPQKQEFIRLNAWNPSSYLNGLGPMWRGIHVRVQTDRAAIANHARMVLMQRQKQ